MGEIFGKGLCLTLVGDGNLVDVSADVHGVILLYRKVYHTVLLTLCD